MRRMTRKESLRDDMIGRRKAQSMWIGVKKGSENKEEEKMA